MIPGCLENVCTPELRHILRSCSPESVCNYISWMHVGISRSQENMYTHKLPFCFNLESSILISICFLVCPTEKYALKYYVLEAASPCKLGFPSRFSYLNEGRRLP